MSFWRDFSIRGLAYILKQFYYLKIILKSDLLLKEVLIYLIFVNPRDW